MNRDDTEDNEVWTDMRPLSLRKKMEKREDK